MKSAIQQKLYTDARVWKFRNVGTQNHPQNPPFLAKKQFWCLKIFSKSSLWQSIGMPRTHKQLPLKAGIAMADLRRSFPRCQNAQVSSFPWEFQQSNFQESNEISKLSPFFRLPWFICGAAVTKNQWKSLKFSRFFPQEVLIKDIGQNGPQQPKRNTWSKARTKTGIGKLPLGIFQGTSTHREQENPQKSIWKSRHLRQRIPSSRFYSGLYLLQIAIVVPFLAPFFACLILIDHFGSTKIGTSSNLSITRLSSFSISLSPQGNFENIPAQLHPRKKWIPKNDGLEKVTPFIYGHFGYLC